MTFNLVSTVNLTHQYVEMVRVTLDIIVHSIYMELIISVKNDSFQCDLQTLV